MVRSWGLRRKRELVCEASVFGGGSTLAPAPSPWGAERAHLQEAVLCSRGQDELHGPKVLENVPPVSTQRCSFPEPGNLYLSWRSSAPCVLGLVRTEETRVGEGADS